MSENKHLGLIVSIASLTVASIGVILNVLHFRVSDKIDYLPIVGQLIFFVGSIALTAWALYRNLKDANRAKSLQAQIVTLKDEFKLQNEGTRKSHAEELRRLEVSHNAYLSRAQEARSQCETERREALVKVEELKAKLASPPHASKLVIHSAYYGNSPDREESVLERLKQLPLDAMAIQVNNNVLDCDPAPNIPPKKRLRVKYSYGSDAIFETSCIEGERLVLPENSELRKMQSSDFWKRAAHPNQNEGSTS